MEKQNKKIIGVLLAGGKSTRMMQDKAFLDLGGKKIIEHVVSNLQEVFNKLILSSNSTDYNFLGIETVPDNFKNRGPAAGLEAVLNFMEADACVVVSCDTPFVTPDFFRFLTENAQAYDAVIPQHNRNIEPMTAYYTKNMASLFSASLRNGKASPPQIIKKANHLLLQVPVNNFKHKEWLFKSINTPNDYQQAKAYYEK